MKKKRLFTAIIFLLAAGVVFPAAWLQARRLIVDTVEITEAPDCSEVRVSFNFPIRYVKHFPFSTGDDLRIQFEPITTSTAEQEALFARETVLAPPNDIVGLTEVVYEGDIGGGPFLTLFFRRPVRFAVEHGADFRSVVVVVAGPESTDGCVPEP